MRKALLVAVALSVGLLAGCGGTGRATPAITSLPSPPTRVISLIMGVAGDPYAAAVAAGARAEARRRGVVLDVADAADSLSQRRRLYDAINRGDRAIIVRPTSYLDSYLLLRTAHDRQIPTFVLDLDPPPANNQAYVWCFLSSARDAAVTLAARLLAAQVRGHEGSVAVVGTAGAPPGPAAAATDELRRRLPGRQVRQSSASDASGSVGVLAPDERAAEALLVLQRRRPTSNAASVAIGATGSELAALRSGQLSGLVVPQAAALGRRAVDLAIAAAANQPDRMPRTVRLPPVVLRPGDADSPTAQQAAYPSS